MDMTYKADQVEKEADLILSKCLESIKEVLADSIPAQMKVIMISELSSDAKIRVRRMAKAAIVPAA